MGWACIWPSGIRSKGWRSKKRCFRSADSPGEPRNSVSALPRSQETQETLFPACRRSRRARKHRFFLVPEPGEAGNAVFKLADEPGERRIVLFFFHPARREQDFHYSSFIRTDGKPESAILAVPGLPGKKNRTILGCRQARRKKNSAIPDKTHPRFIGKFPFHPYLCSGSFGKAFSGEGTISCA